MNGNQGVKARILVVDDSKVVRWTAAKILGGEYEVLLAEEGESAWSLLQEDDGIGLVFCDLQMPGMDGYGLLQRMRSSDDVRLINLPVIIITGEEDSNQGRERVLALGATDFILKPFDELILKRRATAYMSYEAQMAELRGQWEADTISGLASARFFNLHGERDRSLALRHETELTIAMVELDGYRALMQQVGKPNFSRLLFQIGQRLQKSLRQEDVAARIGIARFGLILPLTNRVGGMRIAERVQQEFESLIIKYAGKPLKFSVSVGVAGLERVEKGSFALFLRKVEQALQQALEAGGNRVVQSGAEPAAEPAAEPLDLEDALAAIRDGRGGELDAPRLAGLLGRIWPLLTYADRELELGMGQALEAAGRRLQG
jgi:diguanylate cyclase (GGDEF)-like protein